MRIKLPTPWGDSQGCVETDVKGIEFHHTSSHGGYWVSPELAPQLADKVGACIGAGLDDPSGRGGTWWEEDCAWAFVALAFPEAFPSEEAQKAARNTMRSLRRVRGDDGSYVFRG